MCYSYGRAAEIASKEDIPQVRSVEQHPMLAKLRDTVEQHLQEESARWQRETEYHSFVSLLGRAGRCSHRIINEFEKGMDIGRGHFQPWAPLVGPGGASDAVAVAAKAKLLSVCPIGKDWSLPAEDRHNYLGSEACLLLTELARKGDYDRAKEIIATEKTAISTRRFSTGITYTFCRTAESAQLSILAREMFFRGDYEKAEKIIDYLIFTEDLPQGKLHHMSAWIKYELGRLSEAITMLLDCPQAALCEGLHADNTDADVLEYRLLLAELLLRDERLYEAYATISRLQANCEVKGINDHRFHIITQTIKDLNADAGGNDMALKFGFKLSFDRSSKISRGEHDHDMPNATQILMTPLGPRGMPCNMDRFRCLFPEIN
jgi:hypothetical protein